MTDARDWLSPKSAGSRANIALGTMNFGTRTPEEEAFQIMTQAISRGVLWFDTANAYGNSEEIIGRFLKTRPKQMPRIATKAGVGNVSGPPEGLSAKVLEAAIDNSLRRLQVEHIDLFYLHAPDRDTPIQETIAALERARRAGKIGEYGVSNFASWRIAQLNQCSGDLPRPRVSQVLYNMLVRQLDVEYFDFAKTAGIHTTVYNPLAGGLLAGKSAHTMEAGGRFEGMPRYQKRYLTDRLRELADAYAKLAQEAGIDRVLLAYSWLAAQPGVDSILLGPATFQQLDAGINGCERPLSPEVGEKIDQLYRDFLGTDASYAR